MIIVTGASGHLGRAVMERLLGEIITEKYRKQGFNLP